MEVPVTITLASVITILNFAMGLSTFLRNRKKEGVNEVREADEKDASNKEFQIKAQIKLDQICTTVTEIRSDIKALDKRLQDVDKRLYSAEKAIDSLNERVTSLEKAQLTHK